MSRKRKHSGKQDKAAGAARDERANQPQGDDDGSLPDGFHRPNPPAEGAPPRSPHGLHPNDASADLEDLPAPGPSDEAASEADAAAATEDEMLMAHQRDEGGPTPGEGSLPADASAVGASDASRDDASEDEVGFFMEETPEGMTEPAADPSHITAAFDVSDATDGGAEDAMVLDLEHAEEGTPLQAEAGAQEAEGEDTSKRGKKKAKKDKKSKKDKKGKDAPDAEAGDPESEDADEEKHGLTGNHRFGLRLGSHKAGNFLLKVKARLKKEVETEADVQQHEVEEAISERIEPDERYKEIETYPIHPPYAYVRILFDDERKEYLYQVLEPLLTKTEKEILDFLEDTLVDNLTVSPEELEDADELEFITDRFNDVIFDYSIILHEDELEEEAIKKKLLYYLRRDFIGHGPVDALMEDPYIEDISCDGPHVPVFLYHRKYESMKSTVKFGEHEKLDAYVIKMAQRSGKHISIAEPILDATMTDGSRLQSTLGKEVSAGGSTFTIRKFRPDPFTPPDLVMFRTMSAEMLAYLWIAVQNGGSIMYAGGTASGKTTSLNAILLFIPPNMKIVSIEDTREVNLPHENWIAGITRSGFGPRDQFGRQAGEIDMFQLLKNALRQRPEYIIVGEVRGQEAYSLFQAMATGHAAYGTMHADSVDAVIHRLESDPINIPRSLLEALDIVSVQIQTRVGGKRVRRTKQISEIVGLDPHTREILTNEVFRWMPKDDSFRFSGVSYILERIQLEKGMPAGSMVKELKRRAEIIEWMIKMHIQDYQDVSRVVTAYYKEPEVVLSLVRGEITHEEAPMGLRLLAERGGAKDDSPLSAAALAAVPGTGGVADGSDQPSSPQSVTAAHHPEAPVDEAGVAQDEAYLLPSGHAEDDATADDGPEPSAESIPVDAAAEAALHEASSSTSEDLDAPNLHEAASEPPGPPVPSEDEPVGWDGTSTRAEAEEEPAGWGGEEALASEDPLASTEDASEHAEAGGHEQGQGSRQVRPGEGDEWLRKVEEKIRARYEELEKEKKAKRGPDGSEEQATRSEDAQS